MNKLYTLSYFRKRLFAAGIESKILIRSFPEGDKRYWMISIFKDKCILCTCYKTGQDYSFEFWDGGNDMTRKTILKCMSMNVIIKELFSWIDKPSPYK